MTGIDGKEYSSLRDYVGHLSDQGMSDQFIEVTIGERFRARALNLGVHQESLVTTSQVQREYQGRLGFHRGLIEGVLHCLHPKTMSSNPHAHKSIVSDFLNFPIRLQGAFLFVIIFAAACYYSFLMDTDAMKKAVKHSVLLLDSQANHLMTVENLVCDQAKALAGTVCGYAVNTSLSYIDFSSSANQSACPSAVLAAVPSICSSGIKYTEQAASSVGGSYASFLAATFLTEAAFSDMCKQILTTYSAPMCFGILSNFTTLSEARNSIETSITTKDAAKDTASTCISFISNYGFNPEYLSGFKASKGLDVFASCASIKAVTKEFSFGIISDAEGFTNTLIAGSIFAATVVFVNLMINLYTSILGYKQVGMNYICTYT